MPISVYTDHQHQLVVFAVESPYTQDEWEAAMEAMLVTDTFQQSRRALVDRRAADAPSARFVDFMLRFFVTHRRDIGQARAAILVRDEASFGMGRMTQLRSEFETPDVSIQTFRDYDEAMRWLTDAA